MRACLQCVCVCVCVCACVCVCVCVEGGVEVQRETTSEYTITTGDGLKRQRPQKGGIRQTTNTYVRTYVCTYVRGIHSTK